MPTGTLLCHWFLIPILHEKYFAVAQADMYTTIWLLDLICLVSFFLSSWLSMAQVFLWKAVQKVLALSRPAKTRSNRRSNRNKSTQTRHMAHAIGRRMGSDQYNRWNRGTAPALPSSSRMLNPDLKKTASAIYNPNPKGKWVDQVNHRATPGSPFDRFFDPFNFISRATALVPPTPLMWGMAVERKEHGDRIQK